MTGGVHGRGIWIWTAIFAVLCSVAMAEDPTGQEESIPPSSYRWVSPRGGVWNEGKNWSIQADNYPAQDPPGEENTVTVLCNAGSGVTNIKFTANAAMRVCYFQDGDVRLDMSGHTLKAGGYLLVGVHKPREMKLTVDGGRVLTGPSFTNFGHWAGSRGMVTLLGEGASWEQQAGTLSVGAYGHGSVRVEAGAVFKAAPGAHVAVGYHEGSEGTITLTGEGSALDVGGLSIGGNAEKAGGVGRVEVGVGTRVSVRRSLAIWPRGELSLAGGELHLDAAATSLLQGGIGGSGRVVWNTRAGEDAVPLFVNEGRWVIRLGNEPLRLVGCGYRQTPSGQIAVTLPANRSKAAPGVVVETNDAPVRIEGGAVAVTFAEKGRYGVGDAFDLIVADRVELAGEMKVQVTGPMGSRWGGKVVVADVAAGAHAGRQVLRLVLGTKK